LRPDDLSIRRRRPAKPVIDPWRPLGVLDETERTAAGPPCVLRTVFLAGAECPFTCVFCDLWRQTLDGATPRGALPRQIEAALADGAAGVRGLKLYNASNFFDARAVPPADLPAIARLTAPFERVVVECHPRLVDDRCARFHETLTGRLELALGLETVHAAALPRLNKKMSLDDFAAACRRARRHDIALRTFVLVGAPFVPPTERMTAIEDSVRFAIDQGVEHVALIPVRAGAELAALAQSGDFAPPDLRQIEEALERGLALQTGSCVVTLDTWDLERHAAAPCCAAARRRRLRRMNAEGVAPPAVSCAECGP
jgi:archaeosine synthase beta-subunit